MGERRRISGSVVCYADQVIEVYADSEAEVPELVYRGLDRREYKEFTWRYIRVSWSSGGEGVA